MKSLTTAAYHQCNILVTISDIHHALHHHHHHRLWPSPSITNIIIITITIMVFVITLSILQWIIIYSMLCVPSLWVCVIVFNIFRHSPSRSSMTARPTAFWWCMGLTRFATAAVGIHKWRGAMRHVATESTSHSAYPTSCKTNYIWPHLEMIDSSNIQLIITPY